MKTTIAFLFVALFSVSSYSQEALKADSPLIATWVYVGNIDEAPKYLAGETLTRIEFAAGDEKSTVILGEYFDYNHIQPSDQFIAKIDGNKITGTVIEGIGVLSKQGISTITIECEFDPATDALFVTHGDEKLIFMRE